MRIELWIHGDGYDQPVGIIAWVDGRLELVQEQRFAHLIERVNCDGLYIYEPGPLNRRLVAVDDALLPLYLADYLQQQFNFRVELR